MIKRCTLRAAAGALWLAGLLVLAGCGGGGGGGTSAAGAEVAPGQSAAAASAATLATAPSTLTVSHYLQLRASGAGGPALQPATPDAPVVPAPGGTQ